MATKCKACGEVVPGRLLALHELKQCRVLRGERKAEQPKPVEAPILVEEVSKTSLGSLVEAQPIPITQVPKAEKPKEKKNEKHDSKQEESGKARKTGKR